MTERHVEGVIIEIPKGSRNKYEYDQKRRLLNSTECFILQWYIPVITVYGQEVADNYSTVY